MKAAKELTGNLITHAGIFHADDVMAAAILDKALGGINFISRVFSIPEDIRPNAVIFDIGGGKFDHHQKGGNGCRENGIPYAAAGLIWKEYGPAIVADSMAPEFVWNYIDEHLIQGIDAIDNGVGENPDKLMTLSAAISGFNPTWDSDINADEVFIKATEFATAILNNALATAISIAKAEAIVEDAIEKSEEGIMILEQYAPWDTYVFNSNNQKAKDILFVVFPSNRGGYMWQCVPDQLGSFGQRKTVPETWKGLRDKELQEATGVADAVFCHQAGFCGSAESLEGAIAMAKIAVVS